MPNTNPLAPAGWPDGYYWDPNNRWYNDWRLRPSSVGRSLQCHAHMVLPSRNFSILSEESLRKREYGTTTHLAFKTNQLPNTPKNTQPYVPENHEVKLRWSYTAGPLPALELDNDTWRSRPESRAEIVGEADYLRVYEVDGIRIRLIVDLKTGKEVKEEHLAQCGLYHILEGSPVDKQITHIWHLRPRSSSIYAPGDFAQTEGSIEAAVKRAVGIVHRILIEGPSSLTDPEPGPACGFCPSRFDCEAYYDGYVALKPKHLKNWLIKELDAYEEEKDY